MRTQILASMSLVLGVAAAGCSANSSDSIANLAPVTQGGANAREIGRNGAFPGAYDGAKSRSVNWSEFGFIPSGGRFNSREQILSPRKAHRLRKRWSYFTGCSGSICGGSSAAVANGKIYVGSYDGNVYALKAASGAKLWSFPTGGEVFSSPAVAKGVVYVGSNDKNVYALNAATGAKLWSYTTGYDVVAGGGRRDGLRRFRGRQGIRAQSRHRGKGVVLHHPARR